MESFTNDQLKKVVDELEAGMRCYWHRQTGEWIAFPDPDQFPDADAWQEEQQKLADSPEAYLEIIPMSSRESFELMERFVDEVESEAFRNSLRYALSQYKPFRRFKELLDESGTYRQQWFAFRENQTIEWLRKQLTSALED